MFERAAVAQLFGSTNENYRAGKLPLQLAVQIVPSIDGVLRSVGEAPDKFHIILLDVNLDRGQTSEQIIGWVREKVGDKVPIVLFSATAHMDTARALRSAPATRAAFRPPPAGASRPPARPRSLLTRTPPRAQVRRCLLLGADAFVTKPLPLGFFMHLWQYCLRRDPDFFSGIVLNHPRTSGHLEAGALPPSAVRTRDGEDNSDSGSGSGEDLGACRQQ